MKISNVKIYDLEESLIASGYPMRTQAKMREPGENDFKRGHNLSLATTGDNGNGAHDQFLTGIRVNFDLTCTNKMWVEAERYRFLEFVSSQSTMHRITKFDIKNCYNEYVDERVIAIMVEKVEQYNALVADRDAIAAADYYDTKIADLEALNKEITEKYLEILYTNPAGFELTARMTTNYRCLKNIYKQRKDHRLPEWREFCRWVETLPYAHSFILTDAPNSLELI